MASGLEPDMNALNVLSDRIAYARKICGAVPVNDALVRLIAAAVLELSDALADLGALPSGEKQG